MPANGKLLPDEEASRLAVLFRIRCHKEGASPLWRTTEGDVLYEKTGYQIHHRSGTAGGGGNRALPLLLHQRLGSEDRLPVLLHQLVLGLLINSFWISVLYSAPYVPLLGTRVLQCAVLAPVEFLTIGILARILERFGKQAMA